MSCDEARLAYAHVASLPLAGSGFKTESLQSRNISDSDMDYIPNVFETYLDNSVPEVRQIPPPRWFVAYYKNGSGNFIHASRYLSKEIGMVPEGNLKKYVQKVTKLRNSSNIVLVTFFGSTLPDSVHIGPINLRVRSRQCPRYRLEQDILQLANSQFISFGSASRELPYRQKDGTGATSYASLAARCSAKSAGPKTTSPATSRSVGAGDPVHLANRFVLLSDDSVESSVRSDRNNSDMTNVTHVVNVHLPPASPKPLKGLTKRHRGSAESIDLAQHKQSKVSPGVHDRESSKDRSAMVAPVVSVQPSVTLSVSDQASCDEDGLSMETSDDIATAVPRGPAVSKSVV
ncbi:hypothetical protein E2C01_066508 [Portunus trituberculatus]|uniref:Uncharacterized protein n=1 Tax=Portunus trituberculatus TaxID=210409 RepID=A0A5B7HIC6_PORTR|nr:hypothetical protein [Portunus trituberculatus]